MQIVITKGRIRKFIMPESEYSELREEYSGICKSCGEIRHGDTEPDAECYHCDACGRAAVVGIENLLICGAIEFEE